MFRAISLSASRRAPRPLALSLTRTVTRLAVKTVCANTATATATAAAVSVPRRCMSSSSSSSSIWSDIPMGPKDPILGVSERYRADVSSHKLNLGVGAYRDDNGKPVVLKSVRAAEVKLLDDKMNHEYAPVQGIQSFLDHATNLSFGTNCRDIIDDNRVAALQSLSGTGALRVASAFLQRFKPMAVYQPTPTWGNHIPIMSDAGLEVRQYRYYDSSTKGLDLSGMLQDIKDADSGSCILLHACAHNPTGVDPTQEQWKEISDVIKSKQHFVMFDMAYQGFASGDPDIDAWAVNYFVNQQHDIALCQSFAKNFGLYGQRAGTVSFITSGAEETERVQSQLKIIGRAIYSNPPLYGARLVDTVLSDPQLAKQWRQDVHEMASRIIDMRIMLKDALIKTGSSHNWDHVTNQIGMFCYSGMTPQDCARLEKEFNIYLTSNGRISMAGVTSSTVEYLANAIHQVTKDRADL
jgi:aspartate aminotransferase, mitochondrial